MEILFIADPPDTFKIHKDSTYAMMREAARRGHTLLVCETWQISWSQTSGVVAQMQQIELDPAATATQGHWFTHVRTRTRAMREIDATLMRKDPPFDAQYIYCTHLLEQAQREGARVFNNPAALRNTPEKLALMRFAHLAPPTLVSRSMEALRHFHHLHGDVVFKPLDGMGGAGIFRVRHDALNLGSVLEMLSSNGAQTIMAQAYLPAIAEGDKRVLLIDGEPLPYCLARIPQGGEVRANLAAGGKGVARALSEADRHIAAAVGKTLASEGLLLVGLDVIGDRLTEINVTSPTCFQEIADQSDCEGVAIFMNAVERASKKI